MKWNGTSIIVVDNLTGGVAPIIALVDTGGDGSGLQEFDPTNKRAEVGQLQSLS